MAKKQTRRSISVRGVTYLRLRDYCGSQSMSISDFIEQRIADYFDQLPTASRPTTVSAPAPRRPEPVKRPVVDKFEQKAAATPVRALPTPIRPAQPVARMEPVLAPRAVPATSTINRPMPVAARRSLTAVAPVVALAIELPRAAAAGAVGRPAPTPAHAILKAPPTPRDVKDYRAIRF